ncbi:hypothetical protein [Sphingorhabdus sp.]|uniref:hypothetical protein n=1 Tax=Sphingorhabdus sp. TaxID=1902408 RepID=UPI00333FE118
MAAGLQTGQPMPYLGEGPVVSFTPGGSLITGLVNNAVGGGTLQQFQIFTDVYRLGGEVVSGFSSLRVVKGEVVWSPRLLTDDILPTTTCTTQATIETWFDLPSYPVFDDGDEIYIGNGGLVIPNVAGVEIGIFIFKPTMLPVDVDPIIVALPDYVPSCPVVVPFTPPVDGAVWEVVKIGSMIYIDADPEADPPVRGGWQVTQNFIGSMTLPGSNKGGGKQSLLPAQLVTGSGGSQSSPFQCFITEINGERYLQLAIGSVSYSSSNMPLIFDGAFTHTKQAYFNKVQICPSGWRTSYNEMYPPLYPDPDPAFSNTIMEGGGGFALPDSNDPIGIYAFKWDADNSLGDGGDFLTGGLPTLAIFALSNPTDINKVTKDCGPSIYEQTMNVQPMSGYKASETELAGDWGHCHTTWLNPRKIGYNCKAIATILPVTNTFSCLVNMEQIGVPMVCNTIQAISLIGKPSGGVIVFSYGGIPSPIPFPVTTTFLPFSIIGPDELALFQCLNSIPELTGNVQVSRNYGGYYVTFVNGLQGMPIDLLTANISGVTRYDYTYQIVQYHTGNLDLTSPMQMGMTQLMNEKDLTEADDPYNKNKDGTPAWKDIVNKDDCLACKNFSGDVTTEGVYQMLGFENNNPSFFIAGGCTPGDVCEHPFQVHKNSEAEGTATYSVCEGMVNNIIPSNITDTFDVVVGEEAYIWVAVGNTGTAPFVLFPDPDNVTVDSGATVPPDTDALGYIAIAHIQTDGTVAQLVTGSVWASRIKIGTNTAQYFYAGV